MDWLDIFSAGNRPMTPYGAVSGQPAPAAMPSQGPGAPLPANLSAIHALLASPVGDALLQRLSDPGPSLYDLGNQVLSMAQPQAAAPAPVADPVAMSAHSAQAMPNLGYSGPRYPDAGQQQPRQQAPQRGGGYYQPPASPPLDFGGTDEEAGYRPPPVQQRYNDPASGVVLGAGGTPLAPRPPAAPRREGVPRREQPGTPIPAPTFLTVAPPASPAQYAPPGTPQPWVGPGGAAVDTDREFPWGPLLGAGATAGGAYALSRMINRPAPPMFTPNPSSGGGGATQRLPSQGPAGTQRLPQGGGATQKLPPNGPTKKAPPGGGKTQKLPPNGPTQKAPKGGGPTQRLDPSGPTVKAPKGGGVTQKSPPGGPNIFSNWGAMLYNQPNTRAIIEAMIQNGQFPTR